MLQPTLRTPLLSKLCTPLPHPAGESVLVTMGKFGPFLRCGAASRALPKVRALACIIDLASGPTWSGVHKWHGRRLIWAHYTPRPSAPSPSQSLVASHPILAPLPTHWQGYDPLDISLADALQVLASKQRWSTSKKERKAAADAAAAKEQASAPKPRRGRPKKDGEEDAESAAEVEAEAAAVLVPVPEEDSRHQAAAADVKARLALDAAASLEIDQLKGALQYSAAEAAEAERMAAALDKLRRSRGQTAFNIFVMSACPMCRAAVCHGAEASLGWGWLFVWC